MLLEWLNIIFIKLLSNVGMVFWQLLSGGV